MAPLPHLPLHNGLSSVSNDLTTGTDQRSASFWAAVSKTDNEAVDDSDHMARTVSVVKMVMDKAKKGGSRVRVFRAGRKSDGPGHLP